MVSPKTLALVCLGGAALLAGCMSSSPMSRIDADRELYRSWPLDVQEAILAGRAENGMTHEQVRMALGKPTEVTSRLTRNAEEEIWIYRKGGGGPNLGGTSVSIGGGIGGVSVGSTGIGGSSTPVEEFEVVFVDGKVVRSNE